MPPRCSRGFVLLTTAVSLIGLLALLGLAIDVARIYVARGELQVFADEAAMAATFELDGTAAGISRARDVAAAGPGAGNARNRWYFGTELVQNAQVQFAAAAGGPFYDMLPNPGGYRFIKVRVTAGVPLYFLPVVPGIAKTQNLDVSAVAGQCSRHDLGDGLAPFTPAAHDNADADFGFTPGQMYTLRWAPAGQREKSGGTCTGDAGFDPGSSSDRGYVDVGQGSGASSVRDAVVNNSFFLPAPLQIGSALALLSGQESVPSALEQRFNQDTDVSAAAFGAYAGNGRRLLTVAVNDRGATPRVVGFASFFLRPVPCGTKNTTPCCAEYVGAAVVSSHRPGAGPAGVYDVRLVQ
jgi:hypothetical protein